MESDAKISSPEEARLAEVAYHRKQNYVVLGAAAPSIVLFACFYYYLEEYFQSALFVLWLIDIVVGILVTRRLTSIQSVTLSKRIFAGIAMVLFATNLLTGLWNPSIYYIVLPWSFVFPLTAVMFYGRKSGFIAGSAFCVAAICFFLLNAMPPLTARNILLFQFNVAAALVMIFINSMIYEKARMKIQDELAVSENQYRLAERAQRNLNTVLQQEIERRKLSEKALVESELHYRALFEESVVPLWEEDWSEVKSHLDNLPKETRDDLLAYFQNDPARILKILPLMHVKAVNRATLKLYGADSQETLLTHSDRILSGESIDFAIRQVVSLYKTSRFDAEVNDLALNGKKLHLLVSSSVPAGYKETWENIFNSGYDITERIRMEEEKTRVEQKMQNARQIQAIATLAGGIAHQFNNALAVIYGSLDLLEMNTPANADSLKFLKSLKTSAGRMGRLTDQLLAYAEGGKYQPQAFSVNQVVNDVINSKIVLRDSAIEIRTELSPAAFMTTGDITQIKMVLDVVLSNSFEALQQGGRVIISTGQRQMDPESTLSGQPVKTGDYAFISIEDNGVGMKEETVQRIFEPFFTTKIYGRGLGMAAAFGIVRNHDGMLTVESKLGEGTKVVIYLPRSAGSEYQADQQSLQ